MTTHETPAADATIERMSTRQYAAKNNRGGELIIGYGPGEFSPGDLLKIAILGCSALSSDSRLANTLGDDYALEGSVTASYLKEEDRFTQFFVDMQADLDHLDAQERAQLLRRAHRAIERNCTISHTVKESATTTVAIDGEEL